MRGAVQISILCALLLWPSFPVRAGDADLAAQQTFEGIVAQYRELQIPAFNMGYVENFVKIQPMKGIERQVEFFRNARTALSAIDRASLSAEMRYQYDAFRWAIDFHVMRVDLERKFRLTLSKVTADGLSTLPDGRQWYLYYVQRQGLNVTSPDALVAMGERGMAHAIAEIRAIQKQLGYQGRDAEFYKLITGPKFYITDERALIRQFRELRDRVNAHLSRDFEPVEIAPVAIQAWQEPTRDSAPGYYDNGTFRYTFYNDRFPRMAMEFLFLHEAIPGHHYQTQVADRTPGLPSYRGIYSSPAFVEGWGAYAEDLGPDLGCFRDPWQLLGKWSWALARSARVVLDVRINYEGWTRDRALQWWHANVLYQDEIAEREVDRVIRWPAQSLTYKVGEADFLALREEMRRKEGAAFDLRRFHTLVLRHGAVPLPVLDDIVRDALARRQN